MNKSLNFKIIALTNKESQNKYTKFVIRIILLLTFSTQSIQIQDKIKTCYSYVNFLRKKFKEKFKSR